MSDKFLIRVFTLAVSLACIFFVAKDVLEEEASAMKLTKKVIAEEAVKAFVLEKENEREDYGCEN